MEKKNKFKLGILCICIIIVITMWTGIHTKDKKGMIEGIQDMFIDYIVDVGMSNIGIVELTGHDKYASFQWKVIFEACPFMTYLVEKY